MTLILTHFSRHGIIHASDSNLTSANQNAGVGQKTFDISFLNAGLTIAGAYSVNGVPMDRWMNDFIHLQSQRNGIALFDFSRSLRDELEVQMTHTEKISGSMAHIAGYVDNAGVSHPEFWFVRNVHQIDPQTGAYGNITDNFAISEDFWARDCPRNNLMQAFRQGAYQVYVNGFAPGRISYVILQSSLNQFFSAIWNQPAWQFRPPQSVQETEILVKSYLNIVTTLFQLSDYEAQYIGGGIQTHCIPSPPNVAAHC